MKKIKPKVVLDTGIFISGLFQGSKECEQILTLVENKSLQLYFSQETIGELIYVIKNFARHNIDDLQDRLDLLHSIVDLFYYSMSVNTMDTTCLKSNDKYDDMFIKCAEEGNVDYLVTDDLKSGLHNMNFKFKVLTSKEFIEIFDNSI